MQNSSICNDIIPQIDPKTQEVIDNLKSKMQEIQNSETMKQARDMAEQCFANLDYSIGHSELLKLANTVVDKIHEIKGYSEMIEQSKAFNEQIKTMLTLTLVKVKKSVINIYKKIVSCSRTPRSNNRTSSFSKSTQGDGGESDQPGDPPRHYHLNSSSKNSHCKNRIILPYSRRLASCGCLMAQGVA